MFQDDSGGVNGTYRALDGRLLGAQGFTKSIVSYDLTSGDMQLLAHGDAWNQPNDLCQTPRGDIYFTDPDFAQGGAAPSIGWPTAR